MPRPAPASSALRAPFDYILGTRGAVSVLRALYAARIPLSQTELAKRAGVHLRGLPMILEGLEAAGLVGYAGRGRTRQVQLYPQHPLHQALTQLFQAEANRWHAIQNGLREITQTYANHIVSAWVEGPVAAGVDRFSDPIALAILSEEHVSLGIREQLQGRFNNLQLINHVVIAPQYYQRADLARFTDAKRAELEMAELLYGPAPLDLSPAFDLKSEQGRVASNAMRALNTPQIERPREIAERIAAKLTHDPELIVRAREFIDRQLPLADQTVRLSLLEWKGLLDSLTPGQVASVLREDSARADALRQSLPFVGVLSHAERAEVLESRASTSRAKSAKRPKRS